VQVYVKSIITNRTNFTVEPPTFHIPKYSSANVTVTYSPSSIGEEEGGKVRFVSPQLGEWVFLTSGSGLKPGVHPEDIVGACACPACCAGVALCSHVCICVLSPCSHCHRRLLCILLHSLQEPF
jgi:hypothetical protein